MDDELEEAKRRPCPGCLLYHQTSLTNVESIRKLGLIGYQGLDTLILRGGPDDITKAIQEADAWIQLDGGCNHHGAVFFYNDKEKMRTNAPYVVVDMRDLDPNKCSVESSVQQHWEDLVYCASHEGECGEGYMEEMASQYCQSFMQYPCGEELLETMVDSPNYQPKIPETTRMGEERQVMVYCDIPPEIIKIVLPGDKK